jgi:hypothetical protein
MIISTSLYCNVFVGEGFAIYKIRLKAPLDHDIMKRDFTLEVH